MLDPALIITIALAFLGAVIWNVRLEGRVNGHDAAFTDLDKLLEERDDTAKERHNEVSRRLIRIEAKLDGFKNGG